MIPKNVHAIRETSRVVETFPAAFAEFLKRCRPVLSSSSSPPSVDNLWTDIELFRQFIDLWCGETTWNFVSFVQGQVEWRRRRFCVFHVQLHTDRSKYVSETDGIICFKFYGNFTITTRGVSLMTHFSIRNRRPISMSENGIGHHKSLGSAYLIVELESGVMSIHVTFGGSQNCNEMLVKGQRSRK